MNGSELRAILELKLIHGLGDVGLRRLLRRHTLPSRALEAFRRDPGRAARSASAERIERAVDFIEASGIAVLLECEAGYPPRLRNLTDPPPVLFFAGDVSLVTAPSVAVVGSRRHTEYGATATEMIVAGLAQEDVVVVSGLARGIDRIAHETALCAGAPTVAVLGCGIDIAYPREHLALQEAIGRSGLVVSEFVPGEPPVRHNFPKRNRVLAALAHALIVIEAGPKSGALITVDHALDMGLDVFAVPGPIGRTTSGGTNALIRDGAGLLETPAPVLESVFGPEAAGGLGAKVGRPTPGHPSPDVPAPASHLSSPDPHLPSPASHLPPPAFPVAAERKSGGGRRELGEGSGELGAGRRESGAGPRESGDRHGEGLGEADSEPASDPVGTALLSVLGPMSIHIDDVARHASIPATDALVRLLELELQGVVRQMPGMRFARRVR